jgi:hypothetical protein
MGPQKNLAVRKRETAAGLSLEVSLAAVTRRIWSLEKPCRLLFQLSFTQDHHHQCAATVAMMDAVVRAGCDVMNIEDVLDALPHN